VKHIIKILVGLDLFLIFIPLLIYFLIKLEKDVYNFRTFITEQVGVVFSLFIIIIITSFLLKHINLTHKIFIIILSLGGILIYYLMYDILLPF